MTKKRLNMPSLSLEAEQLWLLLLAVWILVIFGHSMTPADLSSQESGRVLALLCGMLDKISVGSGWLTEHLVRKTAHFCEYAVFGMLLMKNFYLYSQRSRGYRQTASRFLPLALAVLAVPFLDETIQLFSPGRSAQISDVWLDMAGACFGLLAAALVKRLWNMSRRRGRRRRGWR